MEDTKGQDIQLASGTYEVIRRMLQTTNNELISRLSKLNQERKEVFKSNKFKLKANQRISTENTCVARGIVALDDICIFGYNVHFFFQAEDGIRDLYVTGVQTCALPISRHRPRVPERPARDGRAPAAGGGCR